MSASSLLTAQRPDIWFRGLLLATSLTGMLYLPKVPLSDGTIYACGGNYGYIPPGYRPTPVESPADREKREREETERKRQREIDEVEAEIERVEKIVKDCEERLPAARDLLAKLKRRLGVLKKGPGVLASSVVVPEGAMEWLLHEVGHWVASTPKERDRPNYGVSASETGGDGEREWQAWAFEEIVLAPWGPARHFAPPTQRDGAAFSEAAPMPAKHLRHVECRIREERIDVERWRHVYGEWVQWGQRLGHRAPWEAES